MKKVIKVVLAIWGLAAVILLTIAGVGDWKDQQRTDAAHTNVAAGGGARDDQVYTRATFKGGSGLVIDTSDERLEKYFFIDSCSRRDGLIACRVHTGKTEPGYNGFQAFVGTNFRARAEGFDGKNFYDIPNAMVMAPDAIYPERYAEIKIYAPKEAAVIYIDYDWYAD